MLLMHSATDCLQPHRIPWALKASLWLLLGPLFPIWYLYGQLVLVSAPPKLSEMYPGKLVSTRSHMNIVLQAHRRTFPFLETLVTDFPSSKADGWHSRPLKHYVSGKLQEHKGLWMVCLPAKMRAQHNSQSSVLQSLFNFPLYELFVSRLLWSPPIDCKRPIFPAWKVKTPNAKATSDLSVSTTTKRHLYASLHQERKGKSSIRLDTGVVNWLLSQLSNRLSTWSSQPLL